MLLLLLLGRLLQELRLLLLLLLPWWHRKLLLRGWWHRELLVAVALLAISSHLEEVATVMSSDESQRFDRGLVVGDVVALPQQQFAALSLAPQVGMPGGFSYPCRLEQQATKKRSSIAQRRNVTPRLSLQNSFEP